MEQRLGEAIAELERRKKSHPEMFYEPASGKIESFHRSRATIRALFGANRSSKTESAMQDLVWHLLGDHPYQPVKPAPVYWRIVVVDYGQLEKVVTEKLARMIPPSMFIDNKWEKSYNARTHILTLANGSKVDFMTHEQSMMSFEGSSRDGTVFDEEPPKNIFTSCLMRHVDVNGKTIMAMTPLHGLTYTYDEVYLPSFSDDDIDTFTLSIYENRFLTATAIAAIEKRVVDEVDKQIRLYGKFMSRTGLVFKNFDPQIHVYDPSDYEDEWDGEYPPRYYIHMIGIDPGWGHPTGVVWLAMDHNLDVWIYKEHKAAQMLADEHADIMLANNRMIGIRKPIYVIDSQAKATEHSRGSNVWKTYAAKGIVARLGTKKLIDGNMLVDKLMRVETDTANNKHTRLHISNECSGLIQEIGQYQRAPGLHLQDKDRFIDKNNDLIAALRYVVWEAHKLGYDEYESYADEHRPDRKKKDVDRKGSPHTGY